MPSRSPRKVLLNIVHASGPLALNLQLDSFGEAISVINCFVVDWNISLVMFWRFVFRDFWCGGVFKPMPVMMAVSTDLTGFCVVYTRQNSIFNLPSTSLEFRDAAKAPLVFSMFYSERQIDPKNHLINQAFQIICFLSLSLFRVSALLYITSLDF